MAPRGNSLTILQTGMSILLHPLLRTIIFKQDYLTTHYLYRGSSMSPGVLFDLLNELGKRDKT